MRRTILIADDSKTERIVLKGFLKSEYDLMEAESGEAAIAALQVAYQDISAIVLDIVMPGMDGFETLKAIKSNVDWLSIPVIITTALDDDDSREKAIACGADNFVSKPFNQVTLQHILHNVITYREMEALANTLRRDSLTGVLNRESFYMEAERMIRRQPENYYFLSAMNIENFKVINDQYGTGVGDEVIQHVARALSAFAGDENGLVGRYMADKFVLLYPAALKDTAQLAQCHNNASKPQCLQRPVRLRVGRYLVSNRSLSVSAMYDRASLAEALAKGRYGSCFAEYTESMRENLLYEQQIVSDMEDALCNNEFEPWLQPQFNHATGALIGAEALIRWRRDGVILPPSSFIPVFEKNGFIYEIDKFIWRQVCGLLRRWLDEGKKPLPVSVNISRYDLLQQDFMDVICGLIHEYALPVELLRLEITESAFSDSTKHIVEMVGQLIDSGFVVEIDDFGSGYSSLNTLKDVPAAILKLDMNFFASTKNSIRGGNIVESVVRMAKWLGMSVIAEGVEKKEQADYLKTIGCQYIQGYLYAKPMPVPDYELQLLNSRKEPVLSGLETLETLDNNRFWDPQSIETLIFNSYAGGACIFEAHDDTFELMRINEQYVRELHGLIPDGAQLRDSGILPFLDSAEQEQIKRILLAAKATGKPASCELRLTNGVQVEYVRYTARLIANTDDRSLYYAVVVNTTELHEAEQRAFETSERITAIMNNSKAGITAFELISDCTLQCLFANDRFYALLGYTAEQFQREIAQPFDCILPEDRAAAISAIEQLRQVGQSTTLQYRALRRDGSIVWIRADIAVVAFANVPHPVHLSSFLDITEQREAERKQAESAQRLSIIMANINGGVCATRLIGDKPDFILVNEKYFEIIGYTKEEFLSEGKNAFEIVHPDDRARVEQLFRDSAIDKKRYTMEYRIVRRDGAVRHVLVYSSVLQLFGIEELVHLAVVNDITQLRETQQKERDLALQLQAIMEHIHSGINTAGLLDLD